MIKCVAVLFGGVSTEHIVSLRSAYNIIGGLRDNGYEVIRVGITKDGHWYRFNGEDEAIRDDRWLDLAVADAGRQTQIVCAGEGDKPLAPLHSIRDWFIQLCGVKPDLIFPAVHGVNCEDGSLQGLLQQMGFPYVGSGVLASAAAMDKLYAKRVLRDAGIAQCPFIGVRRADVHAGIEDVIDQIEREIGYPCFLKPSNGGSSVGTRPAANRELLRDALYYVSRFDRDMVVEPFIRAREIEVAVLGNDALKTGLVGEIATSEAAAYYDYETKYFSADGADVLIPAVLPEQQANEIADLACRAYQALGCAGLARVDFFLDKDKNQLYLNEINTLPGFTPISVFPKAFAAAGMPLVVLTKSLCELAVSEYESRARQEFFE